MTWVSHRERQAEGQLRIGIQRLAGKYPFHAKILERFDLCPRPGIGTMGVTVAGDDVRLLYSTDFVLATTPDLLAGILLHEVHHVLFGHVLAKPADYPDEWARTVAEEVTVNEFVTEPLPQEAITLERFPGLPPMESTDQRYHRLKQEQKRFPLSPLAAMIAGPASREASHAEGSPQGDGADPGAGCKGVVVDDHSVWQDALQDPERAEAAIRAVVHDAAIAVGDARVPDWIRDALRKMGIGHDPADNAYGLTGAGRGSLPWVQLLRRYVGREVTRQPDFTRPARRFPHLVGIVPGRRRRGGRPHVLAVIDTSGSITPDLLEQINAEMARLAAEHQVTVVECDARIQRVYPYKPIRSLRGRGGTDLRPPLAADFLRRHRPDLVVYFTDGQGPAPEKAPPVPLIWCLTPGGEAPTKWGRFVRISTLGAENCDEADGK